MEPILEMQHITYSYHTTEGETKALEDVSFSVSEGEFIAIVGPSGCGKSTLLSIICGILKPEKGLIKMNGKNLKQSTTNIGYMLQHDHLFEWRTVYHNVLLGLEVQHMLSAKTRKKALELLEQYGLQQFKNSRPSQLSGGMRQRAAFLRTYLFSNEINLLDEPFSALDAITKGELHKWYLNIVNSINLSSIVITHDIDEAIMLSDRIYVMSGSPGSIVSTINVKKDKKQRKDYNLTEEFLEYKKEILSKLK